MKEKIKLWLDDLRPAPNGWMWCKTVDEIMPYLETLKSGDNTVSHISLDNDLGDGKKEGYTILDTLEKWQAENQKIFIPEISVHSVNPVAVIRMEKVAQRLIDRKIAGDSCQ